MESGFDFADNILKNIVNNTMSLISSQSKDLYQQSTTHEEKGAFIANVNVMFGLEYGKAPLSIEFKNQTQLRKLNDATLNAYIASYDRSNSFVLYFCITGCDDEILAKPYIMSKDSHKNTELKLSVDQCMSCNKMSTTMQKCGKCKTVYYCDRTCQVADWPMHKLICKLLGENGK